VAWNLWQCYRWRIHPEQEYFADGLTDSLITQLARISALRVVSRTTVMHYKRIHRPLPEDRARANLRLVLRKVR
jgi:TolB-like protein